MTAAVRALVVTKGHPFEREPFLAMFDALADASPSIRYEHVEHPEAQQRLHPDRLGDIDAIVFYDMPGLRFTRADPPVDLVAPDPSFTAGIEQLLDRGVGMVFLHHTIAAWPAWPRWADIVGGRFHYAPGRLHDIDYPDSGYLLDVEHTVEVLAADHPVCAGLPSSFTLRDELYLAPVLIDTTTPGTVPLLRTTHPLTPEQFFSADRAVRGHRDDRSGWTHPSGDALPHADLLGWARQVGNSPTVYLQPGDGPSTYADPHYQRLLANAINWVAAASRTRGWA
jgi:hypothetical protein